MHYVCSDVHGQYDKFLGMLKKIGFSDSDEMYIVGDVIDRGPRPVDMLVKALTTPNINLLLGNHELMMLEAFETGKASVWTDPHNGGQETLRQLQLMPAVTDMILGLVRKRPLMIPTLTVGDRKFCLVHAGPPNGIYNIPPLINVCEPIEAERMVWSREVCQQGIDPKEFLPEDTAARYENHIFIVGHTPTQLSEFGKPVDRRRNKILSTGRIYNIDCGCAFNAKLGCLRLEDMKEFYVT